MNYQNSLKIGEMEEGKKYPIRQGNGGSDGVWLTKNGNEMSIRHFWEKSEYTEGDDFYKYNEEDGVYYEQEPAPITVIHTDLFQVVDGAYQHKFEDMTLEYFYEVVFLGYVHNEIFFGEEKLPSHLKHTLKFFDENGKELVDYL